MNHKPNNFFRSAALMFSAFAGAKTQKEQQMILEIGCKTKSSPKPSRSVGTAVVKRVARKARNKARK